MDLIIGNELVMEKVYTERRLQILHEGVTRWG